MINSNRVYMTDDFKMVNKKNKVGLLGGTFDPPHIGHLWLGELFLGQLGLSKIVLMPTLAPPHKVKSDMASSDDRIKMCELLIAENHPNFVVSTLEIERDEVSFTADTLTILKEKKPDELIFLIVGADMFTTIRTWKNAEVILKNAVLCTVPRNGISFDTLLEYGKKLEESGGKVVILDAIEKSVSSTEIRNLVYSNIDIENLVTKKVAEFISVNNLYKNSSANTNSKEKLPYFVNIAKGRLSEKRFNHSLKVAEKAAKLALQYGSDDTKAYLAGILHDIHKETDLRTQLQMFEDFGIMADNPCLLNDIHDSALTNNDFKRHSYIHAFSGAAFVENILKVDDRDIINAIRYHCTARAGMSLLEKIIFVADFISEDRTYDDVDVVRTLSEESLEKAIIYCLSYTIRKRVKKQAPIHPYSFEAYNYLINEK